MKELNKKNKKAKEHIDEAIECLLYSVAKSYDADRAYSEELDGLTRDLSTLNRRLKDFINK